MELTNTAALRRGTKLRHVIGAMLTAAVVLIGGTAQGDEESRYLGRFSPAEDRVALTSSLTRAVGEEPYCLGIAPQGTNVLLSRSRRGLEPEAGIVFPTLVDSGTPGRIRVELEALTHAGLIELAITDGFETYRLTDLGREYYDVGRRDFCVRGVELTQLVDVSERPPKAAPVAETALTQLATLDEAASESRPRLYAAYRFRVDNPPAWMSEKGLKRIYPALGTLDGAIAVAVLQETEDGWYLVATAPA